MRIFNCQTKLEICNGVIVKDPTASVVTIEIVNII